MESEVENSACKTGVGCDELMAAAGHLSERVSQVDLNDLAGLAALHTALGQAQSLADSSLEPARREGATAVLTSSMQLLEKIVLKEVDDAALALRDVAGSIRDLQSILTGEALPATALAAGQTQANPTAAVKVAEEVTLKEDDLPLVQEFLGEATTHIETAEAGLLKLEENAADEDAIHCVFRSFHTIKGVAGFLNLSQISALSHAAENVLDLARKGKLQFDSSVADVILQSVDAMRKLIGLLGTIATTGGTPPTMAGLTELLGRLHDCAEGRKTAAPVAKPEKPVASPPAGEAAPQQAASDSTIRVSTDRLDFLINMVGELVIAQAMIGQDISTLAAQDRRVCRNMSHLGKITRELQDLSMSLRMVPIQGVFQKMARLVRDLARKAGKEISFVVTGGETELDRNVVDAISDPLVHMVRNAADHGIEMPEDRLRAGKSHEGNLLLKAYHQAGNIVIEISDDGRGLNKAKLLRKAVENGLVKPGQELSEQEIFQLVFAPGLSTAEKVTDVSGRGVGMDVVRRNVQALRGQIDIASTEGKGSTFTIRLPLTLAVIDGLVVKVGQERYIIPITSIEQSLQPRPEQISTIQNRGEVCMVRDRLVPILRLHRIFGVEGATESPAEGLLVLVQSLSSRCCLLVDELLGQQQVVIKSLGQSLGSIRGISGGAILGDGNVSLILDVPGLISLTAEVENRSSFEKEQL